jgi:uncharacterized protein
VQVERLSPALERAALDYLSRAPYDNVLLSHLILFDRSPATRHAIVTVTDGERVCGVAYFGRQLVLAGDPEALPALAEHAKRRQGERMICGPRETVRAFWELIRGRCAAPRLVRDRQLVMAIDRARLRPDPHSLTVRRARPDEWRSVADSSAAMIEGELAYDPRRTSREFAATVRAMIERDRWWVGEAEDRLCFFCSIGPWCRITVQLQGVWTPPELRGRGLASAALAAICDALLDAPAPTLSLHVNDFNHAAIALYRRVGFEHVSDYQTILF